VHGIAAVSLDGNAISSTRIRQAIRAGEFNPAGRMLGRPWSLAGQVARGDGLGRQIGFPTANLDATGLALPPNGVYVAHIVLRNRTLRAVVNVGFRPTLQLPASQVRVEAHLLDFDEEISGEELEILFLERLRDEKAFPSLAGQVARGDGLGRQIGFPTANLDATGLALPPNGVYVAHIVLRNRTLRAVVNVGFRPTLQLPASQVRVEAHLLDFDEEISGEELEILFLERLRDEKAFPSLAELKAQIGRDVERARLCFQGQGSDAAAIP
jgi:riboflavin kinase/FMN adenylyltransferase